MVQTKTHYETLIGSNQEYAAWSIRANMILPIQSHEGYILKPRHVLSASSITQVRYCFEQAKHWAKLGLRVFMWVAYEAAPAFDEQLKVIFDNSEEPFPLVCVLAFDESLVNSLAAMGQGKSIEFGSKLHSPMRCFFTEKSFSGQIDRVKSDIASGRYYQLNLTTAWQASGSLDARDLLMRLLLLQPKTFAFALKFGHWSVASASPELFFQWDGKTIVTQPMKGTAEFGSEFELTAWNLKNNAKERAENVMIVDLLRNDLSRIALPGSVRTTSLFDVQAHPTVLQMTSTIQAKTKPDTDLFGIFKALFPCGSVTGAPKAESMKAIAELENRPRGLYCGAVGMIEPGGGCVFNVAIRTFVHHQEKQLLQYGVGSGITWYADSMAEMREWHIKSRLAHRALQAFELLETIRLEQGQYQRLQQHLQRMQQAAQFFSYPFHEETIVTNLAEVAKQYSQGLYRCRWLLGAEGDFNIEVLPWVVLPEKLTVALSAQPYKGQWIFTHHKTTERSDYNTHQSTLPEVDDVLLYTEDGFLTETLRGNWVLQIDDKRLTPSDDALLLPGVMRAELLAQGLIQTAQLRVEDLMRAQAAWVVNSLRSCMPVHRVVYADGSVFKDFKHSPHFFEESIPST